MINIKLTRDEQRNLLIFLTGEGRLHLYGNEVFELTNIINKISNGESVKECEEENKE